jgi:hypothetical protein
MPVRDAVRQNHSPLPQGGCNHHAPFDIFDLRDLFSDFAPRHSAIYETKPLVLRRPHRGRYSGRFDIRGIRPSFLKEPHYFGPRGLRKRLATSGGLEHKERLQHLAPERGFISSEPLEHAIVEIGQPLEAMR